MKQETLSEKKEIMSKNEKFNLDKVDFCYKERDVKQFIKDILDDIDKSIDFIYGKLDESDLPEMTQANLSGAFIYLKNVRDLIKNKAGEDLLK